MTGTTRPARPAIPALSAPAVARRLRAQAARLRGCAAGVSAVEFALLAPVLVICAFGTADAGRAIYEKMMMGQSLRAAAHVAMAGADADRVRAVLREVASQNFTMADEPVVASPDAPLDQDGAPDDSLTVGVESYCICPKQSFDRVSCVTTCDTGEGATPLYLLTANKTFEGILLPEFGLAGSVTVIAQ